MRTIILTLLIAMSLMARGQESYELLDFLTDEIVKESNGYIADTQFTEKHKIHVIEFPEYFDFDLVRLYVGKVLRRYSDIVVVQAWHRAGDKFNLNIMLADKYVVLLSYTKHNQLLLIVGKD